MRRAVSTSRRQLRERLEQRAREAGLPVGIPVALAEEVARDAMRRGEGRDQALERAWTYLSCWARHPANNALLSTGTEPAEPLSAG